MATTECRVLNITFLEILTWTTWTLYKLNLNRLITGLVSENTRS